MLHFISTGLPLEMARGTLNNAQKTTAANEIPMYLKHQCDSAASKCTKTWDYICPLFAKAVNFCRLPKTFVHTGRCCKRKLKK